MRDFNAIFFKILFISKFPNLPLPSAGQRSQKSDLASARSELSSKRYFELGRENLELGRKIRPFVGVIAGFKMC